MIKCSQKEEKEILTEFFDRRIKEGQSSYLLWRNQERRRSQGLVVGDEKVFLSTQLLGKYKGEDGHIQFKWRSFHMVGDLKEVKGLRKSKLTWKQFEKYFRKPYLSKKYFDGNIKEFHEHKLGKLTMDAYAKRLL
jgi:hypothetical protein